MTKTYKAVLKSSLVMLVLFAVAGSGVAQAQSCQARATNAGVVRAEGLTEMVGRHRVAVQASQVVLPIRSLTRRFPRCWTSLFS